MADLRSPQLKLQTGVMTDDCTGNGQIETPNTTLSIIRSAAGHGNGENPVATLPDRIRQPDVLTAEQQHVPFLKTDRLQCLTSSPTASDQTEWSRKTVEKLIEIAMNGEIDVRPVIQSGATQMTIINGEPQRLNQCKWESECCTGAGDVARVRWNSRLEQCNLQRCWRQCH